MFKRLKNRWNGDGGYKKVLVVAIPLILSFSAHTFQMFIDRVLLSRYDLDTMPAAMQAGVINFTFISFFMGVVGYVSTFVAQYSGAQRHKRVGPSIWQGVFMALVFGIILLSILLALSTHIFKWLDHDPQIMQYEIQYFRIICFGSPLVLISVAFSCFYTGRGKTWTLLMVNGVSSLLNIVLSYALIFGKFGLPEMGISGAAIATVAASILSSIVFAYLFMQKKYEKEYASRSGFKIDFDLIKRIIRFGLPSGVQFFLDMIAFSLFIGFIGRIDRISQIASTMTFSINLVTFLPMIGMGSAVAVLVGKALGADDPQLSKRSVYSAFHLCFVYMSIIGVILVFFPECILTVFKSNVNIQEYQAVAKVASKLFIFLFLFCLLNTGNIVFSSALKGAGDTKFVMYMSVTLHWLLMVLPPYFIVKYNLPNALYLCWVMMTIFVGLLAICYYIRFIDGKWMNMRVIEKKPIIPPQITTSPGQTTEADY